MQKGGNKYHAGGDTEVTTKEVSRLIDWLKEHGHTYDDIENCIDYISNTPNSTDTNANVSKDNKQ